MVGCVSPPPRVPFIPSCGNVPLHHTAAVTLECILSNKFFLSARIYESVLMDLVVRETKSVCLCVHQHLCRSS